MERCVRAKHLARTLANCLDAQLALLNAVEDILRTVADDKPLSDDQRAGVAALLELLPAKRRAIAEARRQI
jgi:hypothetical protein